jgi:hypothetical protein
VFRRYEVSKLGQCLEAEGRLRQSGGFSRTIVDPPSRNYHLAPDSPAIDLCSNSALDRDMDYGLRPVGPGHDAGADEYDPQIFSDGFES